MLRVSTIDFNGAIVLVRAIEIKPQPRIDKAFFVSQRMIMY